MIRTRVYYRQETGGLNSRLYGYSDVYGEMLWSDIRMHKRDCLIEKDISVHKNLYPWYSGYAWHEKIEDENDYLKQRPIKIVHKSYVIAMRGE